MRTKKVALIILDGWGLGNNDQANATTHAHTPFFNQLLQQYPHSRLEASGEAVGLPAGQMGNSEVGHMNLGAGRVVFQELGRINQSIKHQDFYKNQVLLDTFNYAQQQDKAVHFIGLLSDGGVHAHIEHLKALCTAAQNQGLKKVYIHAFTDGRDTDPHAGVNYIEQLQAHIAEGPVKLASIIGRYYAMDRDNRWERVKTAYDLLVHQQGVHFQDPVAALQNSYAENITDEFVKPIVITENGSPIAKIQSGDAVICFNFRTDRAREITLALTQKDFPEYHMHKLNLHYVTMTCYDERFEGIKVMYEKDDLTHTLGEILAENHKKQIRIAETEKYPHVTFFFSGGREAAFENEKRILVPSPKVATYDLQPEMSANTITERIVEELKNRWADFICLNFANPDMVGHTGVFSAVVRAVETVDSCLKTVVETGIEHGYSFIILADHGNSEFMINADGSPNTAHTSNLVPCILIDKDYKQIKDGKLADVAPSILKMMDIPKPQEMNAEVLI